MTLQHSPRIITDGLVLCLDAANKRSYPGSGTVWTDLAGSNNGTLTNGPTFSSANRGSIVFDGSNDYVNLPNAASTISTFNITVGCWIKQASIHTSNTFTSIKSIVQVGTAEIGSNSCFYLHLRNSQIYFRYQGGSNIAQVSPGINQDINNWHYYVGVSDNTSISFYRDGIFLGSALYSFSFTSLANNNIDLCKTGGYSNYFNGNLAQVSIYNRALTPAEIQQNYNALKGRYNL